MSNLFALSENEYNSLESVRDQIRMVGGLLSDMRPNAELTETAGLMQFLFKQSEEMTKVIRSMDARYEAMRDERQLNCTHWLHALRIASGDRLHTPSSSERSILEGLMNAERIDPDFGEVVTLWLEILEKQRTPAAPGKDAKKPAQRKRDKLAAKAVEVV